MSMTPEGLAAGHRLGAGVGSREPASVRPASPTEAHGLAVEIEFDTLPSDALSEIIAHEQDLRD